MNLGNVLPAWMHRSALRVALLLAVLGSSTVRADHFSGVSLGYSNLGGGFYKIYLELYLDCAGVPLTTQAIQVSNGCGSPQYTLNLTLANLTVSQEVSPVCQSALNNTSCNGGPLPGFRRHRFERDLFFFACSEWKITWSNCCRNVLVNVINEPGTYIELTFNNQVSATDNSPVFPETGIPFLCVNQPATYNPGVSDPDDGNLLIFSLIPARFATPTPFPVSYEPGHSGTNPIPGMSFDPLSGQLNGTPTTTGNYVVVFKVDSYDAFGNLICTMMRDVLIVVLVCDDAPPLSPGMSNITPGVLFGPNSLGVCTGTSFCVDVTFIDSQPSTTLTLQTNALTALPGSTVTILGTNPAVLRICWLTNEAFLPANVFIQAFDGACPIENVASRSILVASCVFLPVELISFTASPSGKQVLVEWVTATERSNKYFLVERSADGQHFEPIGMVNGAGDAQAATRYSFIDESPLEGVSYYRLQQTDLDGTTNFSDVVPVMFREQRSVFAVMEESGDWVLGGLPEEGEWHLVDMLGRVLAQETIMPGEQHRVPGHLRSSSMLMLVVENQAGRQVLRLPIQAFPGLQVSANVP